MLNLKCATWFKSWSVTTFYLQEGQELIQEKPELRSVVQQKLEEIRECWSDLESTTKAKARQLFENNKPEPAVKSYSDLDNQLSHLEQQPPQLEQAHHLPTFNEQLQKFQASLKTLQVLSVRLSAASVVINKCYWYLNNAFRLETFSHVKGSCCPATSDYIGGVATISRSSSDFYMSPSSHCPLTALYISIFAPVCLQTATSINLIFLYSWRAAAHLDWALFCF